MSKPGENSCRSALDALALARYGTTSHSPSTMAASSAQVLPPGAGWAVILALGFGFAAVMLGITLLQQRYTHNNVKNNDEFLSASRSVKPGLIASGIVSAWTWAATLLQSSAQAYKNGMF